MAVLRSLVTTLGLNAAQFREELARSRQDFISFGGHIIQGGKTIAGGMKTVIDQVFSLRSALIAVGTGAALAGIKATYENLDQTAQLGRNIGIAAGQWHAYAKAAEWAGSNGEKLADVIKDINVKIADTAKAGGDSGPFADFFKQIGQSAEEWSRLAPDEQLRRFTAELQQMSATDARFYLDEVNDSAAELFDTLYTNKGELFSFASEIKNSGMALSSGQFAAVRDARLELDRLISVMGALWDQVRASLAPAVAEGSKLIRSWITDSAAARGGFQSLGQSIATAIIEGMELATRAVANGINAMKDSLRSVGAALGQEWFVPDNAASIRLTIENLEQLRVKVEQTKGVWREGVGDVPGWFDLAPEVSAEIDGIDKRLVELKQQLAGHVDVSGMISALESLKKKAGEIGNDTASAALPMTTASAPRGSVVLPSSKKDKAPNLSAVYSFRAENADIARELQNRQELLKNSQRAMADSQSEYFDQRAADIQMRYGADVIEEGNRYAKAQQQLQDKYAAAQKAAADDHALTLSLTAERNTAIEQLAEDHSVRLQTIEAQRTTAQANAAKQTAEITKRYDQMILDQKLSVATQSLAMIEQSAKEGSALQKIAFLAGKGVAMAQTFINTEMAAVAAMAPPPIGLGPVAGLPYSQAIRGMGYASMALIAGTAIAGMAHDGIDNIPREGTWLLDKGERVVDSRTNSDLKQFLAQGGSNGATIEQHFYLSGSGGDDIEARIAQAAADGARQGYGMVLQDIQTRGPVRQLLNV